MTGLFLSPSNKGANCRECRLVQFSLFSAHQKDVRFREGRFSSFCYIFNEKFRQDVHGGASILNLHLLPFLSNFAYPLNKSQIGK